MDKQNIDTRNLWGNCLVNENTLELGDCSGLDIETFVIFFKLQGFTGLSFIDSDIQDSNVPRFEGIDNINNLYLENCPNITDQGLIKLVQIIKPKSLNVLNCSKIPDECLWKCQNTISAEYAPNLDDISTAQDESFWECQDIVSAELAPSLDDTSTSQFNKCLWECQNIVSAEPAPNLDDTSTSQPGDKGCTK